MLPIGISAPTSYLPQEGDIILIQGNSLATRQMVLKSDEQNVWSAIWAASNKYGVEFDILYNLAKCESSLKHETFGDSGRAFGIYQWWESSWNMYNKKFGTNLDRYNLEDQSEMTARVLSEGGYKNWAKCFSTKVSADKL